MCGAGVSDGEGCPGRRFRRGRTSEIVLCYGEILYRERMMVMGAVACGMEDGGRVWRRRRERPVCKCTCGAQEAST